METILLAYDDTRSGREALERAAQLTRGLGAELVVITVAPTPPTAGRLGGRIDPVDSPARRERVLAEARANLTERGIEARYVLSIGRPADAVVRAAEKFGADLILVGRRSTNPFKRLVAENVSESVLHKAHCAVLIARTSKIATIAVDGGAGRVEHEIEQVPERIAA